MKSSKGQGSATGKNGAGRKRYGNWQMVLVDQGPLRRQAASECSREMARLERAKAEWKRFEVEDKAAFARWSAATLGALLSRLREIQASVREKGALIHEIEFEMLFGGARNPRTAYARVQQRRNSPPPEADPRTGGDPRAHGPKAPKPPWEDADGADFEDSDFPDADEMEEVLLFEEYVFFVLGLDPDRLSDAKYDRMFAEFRANVLNKGRTRSRRSPEPQPAPEPPKPEQNRVKELYRLLVRRLHPDTRAEGDAGVSALWHEVQEAYSQGNVERLEMLLALTDIQSNAVGEHTSLFQIRAVLAELRRSYNALRKNLREARRDPAWNFNQRKDRAALEKRMRWELESTIARQLAELRHLEALLTSWSAPRKTGRKPGKKKAVARTQADLPF